MNVEQIVSDPDWLPHRLSPDTRTIAFRHTPREVQRAATFLDDKSLGNGTVHSFPTQMIEREMAQGGALHFIFHSAFCCSTLLVRALDLPGVSMGLKEPEILNDLAHQYRDYGRSDILTPILTLLSRPFGDDAAVIVKPSNVANNLIDAIITALPDARCLLLYAPLRTFLISVAKKGMWGRIWVRRLYRLLQRAPGFEPGFANGELFEQSDMQIAALGWLQQQAQFAAAIRRHPTRFRALDSETLLTRRAAIMAPLGLHFGLPLADTAVNAAVFDEHSKRLGERFDLEQREAESAQSAAAHEEEIAMVERWAIAIAEQFGIPLHLDLPLMTPAQAVTA